MRNHNSKDIFERIGIFGLVITAITSPCCFPLFGVLLSTLGFGSFELFGNTTMIIFLILVIISLVGFVFSYLHHKKWIPFIVGLLSAMLIFINCFFVNDSNNLLYIGMFGMMMGSLMNYYESKLYSIMEKEVKLQSVIICPKCKHEKKETMPVNACQYFYQCEKCGEVLKPKQGDCCVYCSYGSVPCPPIQQRDKNCCT